MLTDFKEKKVSKTGKKWSCLGHYMIIIKTWDFVLSYKSPSKILTGMSENERGLPSSETQITASLTVFMQTKP